jgi:hypothetical protein
MQAFLCNFKLELIVTQVGVSNKPGCNVVVITPDPTPITIVQAQYSHDVFACLPRPPHAYMPGTVEIPNCTTTYGLSTLHNRFESILFSHCAVFLSMSFYCAVPRDTWFAYTLF